MMAECLKAALVDPLDGWGEIAAHVTKRVGVDFSVDAARRAAERTDDPLPVRRWGFTRAKVLAVVAEIDAWVDRRWGIGR